MRTMLAHGLRGLLITAVVVSALAVGAQLRVLREQAATGQAASAATNQPTAVPTLAATAPPPSTPQPTIAKRTVVPTPITTPFTGRMSVISGTVSVNGKPVRGAQVMVYPSNSSNRGPTPMPPEAAMAMTDDRGGYQVSVPPGAYRVGAFRSYDMSYQPNDGFANITWYGDGYTIGFGEDLIVGGDARADIAMLRVLKVAGRVVGRDGVGVPNAQVGLSRFHNGIDFPLVPLGRSATDATGTFALAISAMPLKLTAYAAGRASDSVATLALDLRSDRTDLVVTIDRGHIVAGTLRDASGRPLPNLSFGVISGASVVCGSCGAQSDAAGRFSMTLPSGTLRFTTWSQPGAPAIVSKEYVIAGDQTLDPVLGSP